MKLSGWTLLTDLLRSYRYNTIRVSTLSFALRSTPIRPICREGLICGEGVIYGEGLIRGVKHVLEQPFPTAVPRHISVSWNDYWCTAKGFHF